MGACVQLRRLCRPVKSASDRPAVMAAPLADRGCTEVPETRPRAVAQIEWTTLATCLLRKIASGRPGVMAAPLALLCRALLGMET